MLQISRSSHRVIVGTRQCRSFTRAARLRKEEAANARSDDTTSRKPAQDAPKKKKKTLAELDEELRAAMEGRAGDGGLAGAELEGGKAVGLKRGVKDNMFRYI